MCETVCVYLRVRTLLTWNGVSANEERVTAKCEEVQGCQVRPNSHVRASHALVVLNSSYSPGLVSHTKAWPVI